MLGGVILKNTFVFLVFLLFLSSGLYMTDFFNKLAIPTILVLSIGILSFLFFLKKKEIRVNVILITLMFLMFLSITTSSLVNKDIDLFLQGLVLFFSYLALSLVHNRVLLEKGISVLFKIILLSQLPLIVLVVWDGINFPLTGIFYNPNSFGLTSATSYIVLLSYLLGSVEESLLSHGRFFTRKTYTITAVCLILLLLTVGSMSRTSFIAVLIMTFFALAILLFKGITSRKYRSTIKAIFAIVLMPFTMTLLYLFPPLNNYLYNNILYKFEIKARQGDLFATRDLVWQMTLNDARMFGNGRSYFFDSIGTSAHNTYISFLGQFGWITLIILVLFLLVSLIYSIKFIKDNSSKCKYLPLFLICSFLILSMAETMTHKVIMLAMFSAVGTSSIRQYKQTKKEYLSNKINLTEAG